MVHINCIDFNDKKIKRIRFDDGGGGGGGGGGEGGGGWGGGPN